jgi:hypothetical protein
VRLNADRNNTSTDGFLLNVASVLLQLCAPFLGNLQKVRARMELTDCVCERESVCVCMLCVCFVLMEVACGSWG